MRGAGAYALTFVSVLTGSLALLPRSAVAGATPSSLSLRARDRQLPPGATVALFGRLTRPGSEPSGDVIALELLSVRGRFVEIAHTSPDADGRYRLPLLRLSRSGILRAVVSPRIAIRLVPIRRAIRQAASFLATRAGTKAFAVINDYGRLAGVNVHRRFHSASVVKSMLLVAYLRMLAGRHRAIGPADNALLYPMIHSSDNGSASVVLRIVGEPALNGVAKAAGMTDYAPAGATWGFTEVSAADLARFFSRLRAVIPARYYAYARWLLSTIEPSESWGIPAAARPRFTVLFKGGWLPEIEGLVNQVARLERRGNEIGLAVLTRDDPSMGYGEQTINGVTARLLRGTP